MAVVSLLPTTYTTEATLAIITIFMFFFPKKFITLTLYEIIYYCNPFPINLFVNSICGSKNYC